MAAIASATMLFSTFGANAADPGTPHPERHDYKSAGVFGKFDLPSLQRGLQVYQEVCAACHSLDLISFRSLSDLGYNEDEIKAVAIEYEYEVIDDEGDVQFRPGIPADSFPAPFMNEQQARASNGGALPPDFSTLIKAREHLSFLPWSSVYGEDYLVALMMGYEEEAPEGVEMNEGLYFNHYFAGNQIAMAPPLFDEMVE